MKLQPIFSKLILEYHTILWITFNPCNIGQSQGKGLLSKKKKKEELEEKNKQNQIMKDLKK